ncbi:MAG: c-type cytochrome [Pirellulales bacterium]|nr:c-type cytochrome [Pirellulales bacterium]
MALSTALAIPSSFVYGEAIGAIKLPPGFRAETVYTVPLETEGSWVSLTTDDRGRLIASDEHGALYRITPSPLGSDASQTQVERLSVSIGMAQGLLFHKGRLYVMQSGGAGAFGPGLYRLSDTNGDDKFDRVEQLRVFNGQGEHGPHAIVLGPDGNSLYFTCGNHTGLSLFSRSLVPTRWAEDQLLPCITDPNGHATNIRAPGGWFARTDLDGNNLELFSAGFRNTYDLAFNLDGELFTFDSDMEWDIGTPWYRPTRICHVTSGADFGWRTGNADWPEYYLDSAPAAIDVGPGSPTGMVFGTGAKFPERYQRALFAGDWSYGIIYAFHLTPQGSTYRGETERFASAMPLGVTDMAVRPQDGALYFTVGGRKSESGLYRIIYTGDVTQAGAPQAEEASTAPAPSAESLAAAAEARKLRHAIEAFHAGPAPGALDVIWPHLGSPDRILSTAARIALEHQPFTQWRKRALSEPNADARLLALAAYARMTDASQQREWVDSLGQLKFSELDRRQRLMLLRTAALGVMRLQPLEGSTREKLLSQFNAYFPTGDHYVDRDLANLMVRLHAPGIVDRLLDQLEVAPTQEEAIDMATALSAAEEGWTRDARGRFLDWFDRASKLSGGYSFFGYVVAARERFIANIPVRERGPLDGRISKPLVEHSPQLGVETRQFVRDWKLDEVVELVEKDSAPRHFDEGRKLFSAAGCYNCHRIAGNGSAIGPDLTGVGSRFGVRDLLRAVIEPSFAISDQYQQMVFESNGRLIVGRVTNIAGDEIMVSTNMLDPKKTETIRRDDLDDQHPSDVSAMPAGLLNTLSEDEILDLVAFLRAGGKQEHDLYGGGGE